MDAPWARLTAASPRDHRSVSARPLLSGSCTHRLRRDPEDSTQEPGPLAASQQPRLRTQLKPDTRCPPATAHPHAPDLPCCLSVCPAGLPASCFHGIHVANQLALLPGPATASRQSLSPYPRAGSSLVALPDPPPPQPLTYCLSCSLPSNLSCWLALPLQVPLVGRHCPAGPQTLPWPQVQSPTSSLNTGYSLFVCPHPLPQSFPGEQW